jgi:TRAP-type C4-dicarboxylate transport system permease small subunit
VRKLLDRGVTAAASLLAAAGVLCVFALMVLVTSDVVARYGFNNPSNWADEGATFLLIAIVFLGLAQNLRQGSHIRIDAFAKPLPRRGRAVLELIAYGVGVVFSVVLFFGTWTRFANFWSRNITGDSPLMTPLWIPMLPVLAGAVAFGMVMLASFVAQLHALIAKRASQGEA